VLGDADAPWFGGSATLTTAFLKDKPELAKKYVAAYAKAVDWVRKYPEESRTHLDGFTAIDASLVKEVPLSGFTLYNEFKPSDVEYFQKFFDVFTDRKIFSKRLDVKSMLYTG
jgi:NitT/TauT family transport system substrate-binding protein